MGKFKRVAETQGLPEYLEKQFASDANEETDIYAHLRESSVRHKQTIASETLGHRTAQVRTNDWEVKPEAAVYQQPRMNPVDDQMTNLAAYDTSARAIRRAGYQEDAGENARTTLAYSGIRFGTDEEIMSILLRGTTMFDGEIDDMASRMLLSQKDKSKKFRTKLAREEEIQQAHLEWEQDQMNLLKPRKFANVRSGSVMRTSIENVAAGSTGLPNYDALDDREAQRLAMLDRKREERLSISRNGKAPEDRHREWEENVDLQSNSYQQYQSDWLDKFGDD